MNFAPVALLVLPVVHLMRCLIDTTLTAFTAPFSMKRNVRIAGNVSKFVHYVQQKMALCGIVNRCVLLSTAPKRIL
jgi:hypothetical protein